MCFPVILNEKLFQSVQNMNFNNKSKDYKNKAFLSKKGKHKSLMKLFSHPLTKISSQLLDMVYSYLV